VHLDRAGLAPAARARIDAERDLLTRCCASPARPRTTLIAFDGHPGNFVVDAHGHAWLVDLEKARYGHPAVDLAHATLYTSTTWDIVSHAVLSTAEVASACDRWCERVAADAAERSWVVPLRRAMWLWSVTWCAKWRALSGRPPAAARRGGEDWSAALSEAALVAHVRDRVDHYLSRAVIDRVCDEADALDRAMASNASNMAANTASRRTA
jgi:aminoglycoside phosphotransferase (APT) family kinase protein